MIIVRNTFRLKFGKAREALAVMKESIAIQKRVGHSAGPWSSRPTDCRFSTSRAAVHGVHRGSSPPDPLGY
jgi:hypothetical protein